MPESTGSEAVRLFQNAVSLAEEGRLAEALAECDRAIAVDSTDELFYNYRGMIQESLGMTDEAVESYKKAIGIWPAFSSAHENLRNARMEKERRSYEAVSNGDAKFLPGFDNECEIYGKETLPGYYYQDFRAYACPGYPGHRNLPGKSGLDPMDTYLEEGYMSGVVLQKLLDRRLGRENPGYRIFCAVFGLFLALAGLPGGIALARGSVVAGLQFLILGSPYWVLGLFLLINAVAAS